MAKTILTPSYRAVGAPPEPKKAETYEVISADETAFEIMSRAQKRAEEIMQSDLPEEEKTIYLEEAQKQIDSTINQGTKPLEQPWIDPIDALAGPAGFTKAAGTTFGKLTKQVITGSQRLSGKSTAKAMVASLAAEVPIGQTLDTIDDTMPVDTPWYIKAPITLSVGLVAGGLAQTKIENGISAVAEGLRKNGVDVDAGQVKDAVKGAQQLIDEELTLVTLSNDLRKSKKARDLTTDFKPPKKGKKKTGKEIATEIKAKQAPLFEEKVPTETPAKQYADLDTVKEEAIGIFPDSYIEAEHLDEFFEPGPMSRKLIAQLQSKDFDGIAQEGYARKFFVEPTKTETDLDLERQAEALANTINKAAQHSGANTVTGMTGGLFAGVELDEDNNVIGFNVPRALAVTAAMAVGTAGISKIIAGQKGLAMLPEKLKADKEFQLSVAKKLALIKQPMDKIGLATGWYQADVDKKWRTYVPDKDMQIKADMQSFVKSRTPIPLEDFISHPEMEKYYGKTVMRRTKVVLDSSINGEGMYSPSENLIRIRKYSHHDEFKKTLVHEMQHAIQTYEGSSLGTSMAHMDQIVLRGADILRTPKEKRTIETQQFLDDWSASIKTLPKETQQAIRGHMYDWMAAASKGETNKAQDALVQVAKAYSPAAYRNAYGEFEARAVEAMYDTGPISLKDLTKPGYIDTEQLTVSLWNSLTDMPTKEAMDSLNFLASKMDSEGIEKNIFKRWESYANNKLIENVKFWVDSHIYSDRARKAFGIHLPKKFRELKADYDRQANRALDQTMTIAAQLQELAPTSATQKQLLSVLRGTETGSPEMVQAAQQVRRLFDELRAATLESGLRTYDMYDALTKAERTQLRTVIKLSDNPKKVAAAQKALADHYKAGGSYEYIPVFLKTEEGVVGKERKALTKKLNKLKALARRATELDDDEPLPHLRDEIAELEEILAINKNNAFNTERKHLSQGYANVQTPEEAARLLEKTDKAIANASFTVARSLTEQAVDLQRLSFLDAVKNNAHWVLEKNTDPDLVPSHFKRLTGSKYGPLNGMYVDRVIAEDIDDMGEVTGPFIRNWDKLMGLWKQGKAVFNPATHVGNFTSNVFLAHLGGVSPADIKTYTKAAQALQTRMKNKWFKEAESWGLMNNTFSAAELSQFRKTLSSLREMPDKITSGQKVKQMLSNWMSKPAALYEKNEQFFKMAVFIKARETGASIDQAARKAEEYLFNYRDIPPVVRHYKRWASPFFTFTYKASGLLAKEAARHPHKLAAWAATLGGMTAGAMHLTGTSWDEMNRDHQNMPGSGLFNILLPWKDNDGNRQYWDIGRLIPIGQYEQKWGQTGLPIGSFMPTNNPLTSVAYEIAINKDLFTGQELVDTSIDSLMAKMGYWGLHLYREMTPSLAPGNYSFNNLKKGLKSLNRDIVDYTGQEVTMHDMVVRSIFGFKVTSATKQAMFRSFKSEVMKIDRGIGKRINQIKTKYQRGEITREQFDEASGKLIQQKRFFKERIYDRMKGE